MYMHYALTLVVVSLIYGCATGAFVSLSAPARLGGMSDARRRYQFWLSRVAVIILLVTSVTIGMAITCVVSCTSFSVRLSSPFILVASLRSSVQAEGRHLRA
ncbi:hypothetical protein EDD15DRAFT_2309740 [Pisolithus albus]|nr:hypothetical protein EDD15DRAFT_2309740 [Pisolithus albus]